MLTARHERSYQNRVVGTSMAERSSASSQVSLGVTKHFGKDAKTRLESVLGTRDVFERAMRERLAATHPNVAVRYGCGVTALKHGTGDAQGLVTGVSPASPGSLLSSSALMKGRAARCRSPMRTYCVQTVAAARQVRNHCSGVAKRIIARSLGPPQELSFDIPLAHSGLMSLWHVFTHAQER